MELGWSLFSLIALYLIHYIPNWQYFFLYLFSFPSFLLIFPAFFLLVDSPEFAYLSSKSKSLHLFNQIAKINNRYPIQDLQLADDPVNQFILTQKHQYYIFNIFQYPSVFKKLIPLAIIYFVN